MSYFRRAWMGAAGVSVLETAHANDQFSKWNSSETVFQSKLRRFQNEETAAEVGGDGKEDRGKEMKTEDSLHKVIYLNCWTQS